MSASIKAQLETFSGRWSPPHIKQASHSEPLSPTYPVIAKRFRTYSRLSKRSRLQGHVSERNRTSLKLCAAENRTQCSHRKTSLTGFSTSECFCSKGTVLNSSGWGQNVGAERKGIPRNVQRPARESSAEAGVAEGSLTFRPAKEGDMPQIQWLILKEAMNPLNLIRERFLVAENAAGQLVAFGQVADIPGDPAIRELRSLVVVKEHRGRGIGSALLQKLLSRVEGDVYILTIGRAVKFYERAGFKEVKEAPAQLKLELKLGGVVAKVAAQDRCLVMKATRSKG